MVKLRDLYQAGRRYFGIDNHGRRAHRQAKYHRTLRFEKVEERRLLTQILTWAPQSSNVWDTNDKLNWTDANGVREKWEDGDIAIFQNTAPSPE